MLGTRKMDRHADLVNRMAEATGADLPKALETGQLSPQALRSAVIRCTRCGAPEACDVWLDEGGDQRMPPAFCANGRLFAQIAAGSS